MLKLFTRSAFSVLSGALLLMVQGCATVEVPTSAGVEAASADTASGDRTHDREWRVESLPEWQPDALDTAEEVPIPKVHRGNAAAFDQAVAALRSGRLQEAEVLLQEITNDQPELAGGVAMGEAVIEALGFDTGFTHMEWYRKADGEVVFLVIDDSTEIAKLTASTT